jgi:hypothetical protein
VNFFGHAVAAQRVDDDPAFLLGAMAPDLLPLCGALAGAETSPKVAAGQAHHLAVDRLFHGSQAFGALQAWAARALIERGLPRGGARGAAHVGIELFLDGVLAGETRARGAYIRSLADAETTGTPFVWRDERSRVRWQTLVVRLRAGTIPEAYRDFVAARLVGALASRPRLALTEGDATILRAFLPDLKVRVVADAQALTRVLSNPMCDDARPWCT